MADHPRNLTTIERTHHNRTRAAYMPEVLSHCMRADLAKLCRAHVSWAFVSFASTAALDFAGRSTLRPEATRAAMSSSPFPRLANTRTRTCSSVTFESSNTRALAR